MVILAVGFRPNTALADGKIELFRNGAFLVDKTKLHFQVSMQLVTVRLSMTMHGEMSSSHLHLMRFVQVLLVPTMRLVMNWEGIGVQGSNGISIYGLHGFNWFDS